MKPISLIVLFISATSFVNPGIRPEINYSKKSFPCNALYIDNQSTNGDDILKIKFTNLITNEATEFNGLSYNGRSFLTSYYCDRYDIEITVSVGGINSSVGIKAYYSGSPSVILCESGICCQDGYKVTFNNIRFIDYSAINFDIFLKNGGCN